MKFGGKLNWPHPPHSSSKMAYASSCLAFNFRYLEAPETSMASSLHLKWSEQLTNEFKQAMQCSSVILLNSVCRISTPLWQGAWKMTSLQLSSRPAAGLLAVFAFASNHLIFLLLSRKKNVNYFESNSWNLLKETIGNLGALRHCRPNAFFAFSLA